MGPAEVIRVTSGGLQLVGRPAHLLDETFGGGICKEAIGEAGGPPDRGLGVTAYEDRDWRARHRPHGYLGQVVDVTLVAEGLSAPRLRQNLEYLVESFAAHSLARSERSKLDR